MTYEMYRYIFLGAMIACGIMVAVSAVLFFTLKIPKVIGDLTGKTARKAIENIRKQNEQSGDKTYKSSAVNLQRGKLTDKITRSGRLIKRDDSPFGTGVITEQLEDQQQPVMDAASETTVLTQENETTVLSPAAAETTVLSDEAPPFAIEYEITFIHTDEVIQ